MKFARARRTIGLSLMSTSLLIAVIAAPAAVAAEGEVPDDLQEAEVDRYGYWNADQSNYANNAATSQFPPEAVCLVQPQACYFPEGDQDPTGGLGQIGNETLASGNEAEQELLASMAEADNGTEPADPVQPETYPVSVAFGQPNYRSAIQFKLPPLPDGHQLDSFTMVLTQGDPTYANESPAFRQAVLAALTCAQENPETPGIERCTVEEFEKIPDRDLSDGTPLQVEACPITGTWEAETSQDEDDLPEVDCLFTTAGAPVEGTTSWVFDLTFMAQAWYDGLIEPNGILLRPGGAENFAYGDPETTYSKQVTFESTVQYAVASSEEPTFEAPPPLPPPPPAPSSGSGGTGSTDVFFTPDQGSSQPLNVPSGGTSTGTEQPPAVSQPTPEPVAAQPEQHQTLAAGTPLGEPESPWWLWLLLVPFLGGAWLMTRALEEQAAVATQRSGAMTRLLERQAAQRSPDLITG